MPNRRKQNSDWRKPITLTVLSVLLLLPIQATPLSSAPGEELFINHCSGCHINGGNIIRRSKTLKIKDLQKRSLDNTESIAEIAREGIGIMSGYKEVLNEGEDLIVAKWILQQAQKAWTQG